MILNILPGSSPLTQTTLWRRRRAAYLRLFRGLREAILGGGLAAGTSLPSTRQLADLLKLSRNTVLRAYEQLIAEGLATARHGGGTFVSTSLSPSRPPRPPIATGSGSARRAFVNGGRNSVGCITHQRRTKMKWLSQGVKR